MTVGYGMDDQEFESRQELGFWTVEMFISVTL
jgi:hypothetical protein